MNSRKIFSSNNALLICWPPIEVYGRCTRTNERHHHQMAEKKTQCRCTGTRHQQRCCCCRAYQKKNPNRKQIRKKNMCWFDQIIINSPNNEKSAWCNTFKGLVIMKQDNKITLLHSRSVQFLGVNTTQMDYLNETCKSFIPIIIG